MHACVHVCVSTLLVGPGQFLRDGAVHFCYWPLLQVNQVRSPRVVFCPVAQHSLSANHRKSGGRISESPRCAVLRPHQDSVTLAGEEDGAGQERLRSGITHSSPVFAMCFKLRFL